MAVAEHEPFEPVQLIERDGVAPRLVGKFSLFGIWQEINNNAEGHFFEQIQRGSFSKSIKENGTNGGVQVLLSHGKDPSLGMSVLGKINDLQETEDAATYDVTLFRNLPALLMEGLREGVYGASFRGEAIKNSVNYKPERSDYNPEGFPEVTRTEIRLKDIGPTPIPQYQDTTAVMRVEEMEELLDKNRQIVRDCFAQGAVALERHEEPEGPSVERESTLEDEPQHSADEDVPEEEEEVPSWYLTL